jgi:alpha-3'-ketoglucosidase
MLRRFQALIALSPVALSLVTTPSLSAQAPANTLTPEERRAGWKLLFNGRSLDGWRGYQMKKAPAGWQVVDGAITRTAEGGDLITRKKYGDFELALEWQIAVRGNSGVFYRGTEQYDHIYWSAPEMQVLDDAGHPDGASRLTAAGAAYGLYPAPAGVVKPAGEWNQARIVVKGHHVEHWLNGQQLLSYELGSDDWKAKVTASKFHEWPAYGTAPAGYLGLQDHGDWVAYRSIKLREIR